MKRNLSLAIFGLAAMGPAAGTVCLAAEPPAVYSAAQAQAGAAVYARSCAMCHGQDLEGGGGPPLKGPAFQQMAQAQQLNVQTLLSVVSQSMPQSAPGSLSRDEYAAVVAYLLAANGLPAGEAQLSADNPNLSAVPLAPR